MLQSLTQEKSRMTVYPNGVCYLNAPLFKSIKKRSVTPVCISVKTDSSGCVVIIPQIERGERTPDHRLISPRGGGGSFSCVALSTAICEGASVSMEFEGPMGIDVQNPTGYRSNHSFPALNQGNC